MSSAFENAMSDLQAENYTQRYPVDLCGNRHPTIGDRVNRVIETIDSEIDHSERYARMFLSEAADHYESIHHLRSSRSKFIAAVEALIEEYQL